MKKAKQNGFVLLIVIGALTLIVIEVSILTHISNLILIQSQAAHLEACENNLIESGLAWAKLNIENGNIENFNETKELNISGMNIRRAALSIVVERPENKHAKVQVNTSCSRGRQTRKQEKAYQISL